MGTLNICTFNMQNNLLLCGENANSRQELTCVAALLLRSRKFAKQVSGVPTYALVSHMCA